MYIGPWTEYKLSKFIAQQTELLKEQLLAAQSDTRTRARGRAHGKRRHHGNGSKRHSKRAQLRRDGRDSASSTISRASSQEAEGVAKVGDR